ncbi:MAG: GNAT family N-acetyltransferase [Myxococcota bacterium]|nr:GNAT family N-acetyltransferase [Myxococcota bacterium]
MTISTRWIRGAQNFAAAQPLWESLLPPESLDPFRTHAWAKVWLDTVGRDAEPQLLCIGNPPRVILPLAMRRQFGLRRLEMLGHGVSDYQSPLWKKPSQLDLCALGRAIREARASFDHVNLRSLHLSPEQALLLTRELGPGSRLRVHETCPAIRIDSSWDEYLQGRSRSFRKLLRRAGRRSDSYGDMKIQREMPRDEIFEEMLVVERASWKWRKGRSLLRDPGTAQFIRQIVGSEEIDQEIWTLRIDGTLVAYALILLGEGRRLYFLPSFRETFPSTGAHLLAVIIQDTFEQGYNYFDFLQGDEDYKLQWSNTSDQVFEISAGFGAKGGFANVITALHWSASRSTTYRNAWLKVRKAYGQLKSPKA